jgi:hypothetical protein
MEFQRLEEAGTLEIEYTGTPLDLYAFGVLQTNLQDIIDKVSFGILSQEGLLEPSWKRPKYLPIRPPSAYRRFVKAEVQSVKIGSLGEAIAFGIATVLADPNVIAIMQNLGANVIWAIGTSGVRGIKKKSASPPEGYLWKQRDPFDIGPNLRDVALAVAENNGDKVAEMKFKHRLPNGEVIEVAITIRGE